MDQSAVRQAWEQLHQAKNASQRLQNWRSIHDAARDWELLLIASQTIYNKLKRGAKGHPKSEGWFSKHLGIQSSDPLLSYVMQARNAGEHGIEDVTHRQEYTFALSSKQGVCVRGLRTNEFGHVVHLDQVSSTDGSPVEIRQQNAAVKLLPVVNRGVRYEVPELHLGQPVRDPTPQNVARLVVASLEALVREAGALIQKPV